MLLMQEAGLNINDLRHTHEKRRSKEEKRMDGKEFGRVGFTEVDTKENDVELGNQDGNSEEGGSGMPSGASWDGTA